MKIVVDKEGTLKKGEKVEFVYEVTIPENLGYNLSNLLKKNEYKEVMGQVDLSFVRGSGTAAQVTKAGNIYSDTLKVTGESNETVRIFNKTVEVYESGQYNQNFSGTPLATLSSE